MPKINLPRKAQIAFLNIRIAFLRHTMSNEHGITDQWRRMARNQAALIRQRNEMLTPDEVRKIERERGLV